MMTVFIKMFQLMYVNLAYEIETQEALSLPIEWHNEYQWLTIDELLQSNKYVKEYFKG